MLGDRDALLLHLVEILFSLLLLRGESSQLAQTLWRNAVLTRFNCAILDWVHGTALVVNLAMCVDLRIDSRNGFHSFLLLSGVGSFRHDLMVCLCILVDGRLGRVRVIRALGWWVSA